MLSRYTGGTTNGKGDFNVAKMIQEFPTFRGNHAQNKISGSFSSVIFTADGVRSTVLRRHLMEDDLTLFDCVLNVDLSGALLPQSVLANFPKMLVIHNSELD